MIRTPLRPLTRILQARAQGQNPDSIEKANIAARREAMRDRALVRAESRLKFLAGGFVVAFGVIALRMLTLASTEASELRTPTADAEITAQRADILDRKGRILATNMVTHALYVQTEDLIDPAGTATRATAASSTRA